MIKISFDLLDGYVQGWHKINEQCPAMFEHTADLENEEQLKHFNDNYLDYALKYDRLLYDESHKGFEKEQNKIIIQQQILELKQQLSALDYKTSKYADGEYTGAEWASIVAERKAKRQKIRELEVLL